MMKSLVILTALALLARAEFKASYQVSIQLKNSNQLQICNGIIIHEEYVLTTANCFYLRVANTDFSFQATAGDLSVVVGGAGDSSTTSVERNVVSIIPHHKFNKTTYDNDIAVLKLDGALPLANSGSGAEIQWLDIATCNVDSDTDNSCFLTVFNGSQATNEGFYSIWRAPDSSDDCRDANGTNSLRKADLCLEYALSSGADCISTSINLIHSSERGTAYVCNNKLVGILADINPPRSVEECVMDGKTTGFYVDVRNYVEWLSELGIPEQTSVPSWTLEPLPVTVPATTEETHSPDGAAKISSSFLVILLLALLQF